MKVTSWLVLIFCTAISTAQDYENAMIEEQMSKEMGKISALSQQDSQASASRGSAYNSIISNYYTNDPYYGPAPPASNSYRKYSSKDEALQRLKDIIQKKKTESYVTEQASSRMDGDQTIHRSMIPAPLLARVPVEKEEYETNLNEMEAIPAPLLVGGAYRVKQGRNEESRFAKKTLEVEEDGDRRRQIKLKIKKKRTPSYMAE